MTPTEELTKPVRHFMSNPFGKITPSLKTGEESFHEQGRSLDFTLLEFWRWSTSDIMTNTTRGILAEFIVAKALGSASVVRYDWGAYDLEAKLCGNVVRVEIKSTAYLQSWAQTKLPRNPGFVVKKSKQLDQEKGKYFGESLRPADVYVFALLAETDKSKVDPLDLSQWKFFVLPTSVLNARESSQHSITINSLSKLTPAIGFSDLQQAVIQASDKT